MTPVNVTATEAEPLLGVELLVLVSLYGIVLVVGVVGNSMVAVVMCTQQTARMRNNLMLSVCVSDLLVCALSGPLAAAYNTYHNVWMLSHVACKLTAFLQVRIIASVPHFFYKCIIVIQQLCKQDALMKK
jgi:hypothetical protein